MSEKAHEELDMLGPGLASEAGGRLVAGVVIETVPNRAPDVAVALGPIAGLEIIAGDGDHRLAGVWIAVSGEALLAAVQELVRSNEEIVGVFPTFVGRDHDAESG